MIGDGVILGRSSDQNVVQSRQDLKFLASSGEP